jgi:hypothetical protein
LEEIMKVAATIFGLLACSSYCAAQQTAMVQMQCHDLAASNNFVASDEVLVNGMACRYVKAAPAANQPQAAPAQVVNAAPAAAANAVAARQPVVADVPVSSTPAAVNEPPSTPQPNQEPEATTVGNGEVTPGSRIVIAPMGGFETYFAAAIREKKVPVKLTLSRESAQFFVVSTETEWHGFVYGSAGGANWNQNGGAAGHTSSASSTRGLEASIMLIDAKTKDVVWAYEVHKSSHGALLFGTHAARGQQSLAEACAKHLKEYIEKGK